MFKVKFSVETRFKRFVLVDTTTGCWLWQSTKDKDGYGKFWLRGSQVRAYRVAFELFRGQIPEGLQVLHKCDTPGCVNPKHLFAGTHKDNVDDKMQKRRHIVAFGEASGTSKLTEASVLAIRSCYTKQRVTKRSLALTYGVSSATITSIVERKTWRHL